MTAEPFTSITMMSIGRQLALFLLSVRKGEGLCQCPEEAFTLHKSCSKHHYAATLAGKPELKGFVSVLPQKRLQD